MPGYNLTRVEAEERAGLITVHGYDVTLDLTSEDETFPSTSVIRFSCAEPGAASFLDLIAPTVRRVELNGEELDVAEVFQDCRIHLPNLAVDNTVIVEADVAYSHTGEGLHSFTDPVDSQRYIYTQCEVADARRIFANFEQPDLKSRFTFHVIAPSEWAVISNQPTPRPTACASLTEGVPASCWDFGQTPVMSTYLIAVVAGPYVRWLDSYISTDGRVVPLGAFVRRSMARYFDDEEVFDVTRRGFEFYENAFGVPYPYAKYDQIFVPQYNAGAMENIGCVTLTEERYVFRSKPVQALVDTRANTILHEQAHMWFGDLVTMKWWNDLWLNESFAEFMSHLAASNTRWPDAWADFLASRKLVAYQQDQLPTTHPIVAEIRDLADVEVNFDMITYAKGASVLRQLVSWVGQDNFLKGVHNYLVKYAWGNATLQDFLAEVSAVSGRDLTGWSKVWLEEAGVTLLRPVTESAEGLYTRVAIAQQVPAVYSRFSSIPHRDLPEISVTPSLKPHHILIAGYNLSDDGLTRDWEYEADIDGELTEITGMVAQIVPDLLIINDADLTFAKLRLDESGQRALPQLISKISSPLTRALMWGSLWDALRDGEISARAYVDIVLASIAKETSSTTMMSLLARLRTALLLYVSPDMRAETQDDAAAKLVALAMRADRGSDQQLQFFKAFASLACNDTQLGFVAEVLDGVSEVPGLVVDTDLRWELLTSLVATGYRGEAEIEAELTRDDTLSGTEKAAGARAAIPTLEAKKQAWRVGVLDESISNAEQRNILAAFTKVADVTLLRDFAIEYFAQIEQTWQTRSREMAQNVVEMLYPLRSVNDPDIDVLAMTDHWLDRLGDRDPALRRLVLAAREEVIYAKLAQEVDEEV